MSLDITLRTMPANRPQALCGVAVQRLGKLYKVGQSSQLLSLEQALQAVQGKVPMTTQNKSTTRQPLESVEPEFPPELVAMTTHFPWAWLMSKGYKTEEYRTQPTKRRGLIFLHAGSNKDSDDAIEEYHIPRREIKRQMIIGATRIVDCELTGYDEDGNPEYAYILEDEVYFPNPTITVPGAQSIFWSANSPLRVAAFNEAWKSYRELTA